MQLKTRWPGAGQQLARGAPQHHIGGAQLIADALQGQPGARSRHLGQLGAGAAGACGCLARLCFQGGAGQADTGRQSAFDLDVKPALDGAGHKLVRHHINQQPRRQPHQRKNGRQLDQQAAAKPPAPQPRYQAHGHPHQEHQQQHGHHDVGAKQPGVIALVQGAVVGGQGKQEQQHQPDSRHDRCPHAQRPAHGAGLACHFRGYAGIHLVLSVVRRRLRAMEMFHPDPERPRAPICKGRGSCEVSSAKRRCTV